MSLPVAPRTRFDDSPMAYAKHLATYMRDPSTIRARTREHFGRAPDEALIRVWIDDARRPAPMRRDLAEDRGWPDDDGSDWKPRSLVTLAVPRGKFVQEAPEEEPEAEAGDPARPAQITTRADIIAAIAADYGVSPADITSKSRRGGLMMPRFAAAHVLLQRGNSTVQTGRALGGRDHSTIIHARDKFAERATDRDWAIVRQYYRKPQQEAA